MYRKRDRHSILVTRRAVLLSVLGAALLSCSPSVQISEDKISRRCLESLGSLALTNPQTNSVAFNIAQPLGLVRRTDQSNATFVTRQAQFTTQDGTMHFFGVDSPQWTRAVMITAEPSSEDPIVTLYVLDREGSLLRAGRLHRGNFQVFEATHSHTNEEAKREQRLWQAAGADDACGSPVLPQIP